jgi:hypothetical protein
MNFKPTNLWIYEFDSLNTITASHKDNKTMFIIFYKHYLPKISELKNQLPKLRFEI